ncbi:MAG: two component transcriptional regulator, winged helix family [Paenibacillaceae bacterium]|jgi:DNA-binding response OmpR family regulator|nr:two component transcriptional regulator, winged helix family [Paenibacillaceae bacterium]
MSTEKLLVAEDDQEIRDLIVLYLKKQGYQVIVAGDGLEALRQFEKELPDLVLLDINLPMIDGFGVCREIRRVSNVPVIFISCRKDSEDVVNGLEIGGDDYITKPFDPVIVLARVQANLRRAPIFNRSFTQPQRAESPDLLNYGGLTIDIKKYDVHLDGVSVPLSAKEIQLLFFLAQHPNQVFTTDQLYHRVWGAESNSDTRTVLVHISSLRKKIEPSPVSPKFIHNIRGIGYKFSPVL